ncbi:uncharacterized protein ACBT57_016213 isoform 1-T1 [Dama dama]
MGRKCPTCGVQGTSVGGGGAKKTEAVVPRPRPAGTHEEPDLASWASAPRPDAASSRGPVLPPASRRPSAAHLAQASGGSAGSKWYAPELPRPDSCFRFPT